MPANKKETKCSRKKEPLRVLLFKLSKRSREPDLKIRKHSQKRLSEKSRRGRNKSSLKKLEIRRLSIRIRTHNRKPKTKQLKKHKRKPPLKRNDSSLFKCKSFSC